MDTVREESSPVEGDSEARPFFPNQDHPLSNANAINNHSDDVDGTHNDHPTGSSRRPSAIIAALRRPSQTFALTAAHAVMRQRRYLLSLMRHENDSGASGDVITNLADIEEIPTRPDNKICDDALTTILSALYAKLLVVLGIAFPITETVASAVDPLFYQGFYLYLYFGSVAFVTYMYVTSVKEKALFSVFKAYRKNRQKNKLTNDQTHKPERYGSFYLRLGAIAFGIGSMVYSGLEFGRNFELKSNPDCDSNILQVVTPATRMILTLVQIQFVFLNSKAMELNRHKIVARFGLMHMIATNLCEWLYVLVEETKHEIIHLAERANEAALNHTKYCQHGYLMESVVQNASPFLFPCTIEYSLICAVILYEMWKKMNTVRVKDGKITTKPSVENFEKIFQTNIFGHSHKRSSHHVSIDCSNAHRGLFAGILVVVLTIISLIMFFVLNSGQATSEEANRLYKLNAEFEVNIVELVLYVITTFSILLAMYQMRSLKYERKTEVGSGIGLDNTLLVVAQTGMFIYCIFSIIGCYFTISYNASAGLVTEVFSFIQTCLQTMFVLDGWWRRCRNLEQTKRKPGRELVTFLIIANMAMWTINIMEKNRAEFRPSHLQFFGDWAWTIITHISMPLAIFYRFHSTICLFEIWKTAYKLKCPHGNHTLLPYYHS